MFLLMPRLPSQKYFDQYTGLELDPVGAAAARQSEIDFAWRGENIRASTQDGSVSANGTEAFRDVVGRL